MLKAHTSRYKLKFITPGGTSRGILKEKETYFLTIEDDHQFGIGECAVFRGLSFDDRPGYLDTLKNVADKIESGFPPEQIIWELTDWPSIQFGLETAIKGLQSSNPFNIFNGDFCQRTRGIEINGLIWMDDWHHMNKQLRKKLEDGFTCIKIKIGAIDFNQELNLLKRIRQEYSGNDVEIRVDANGAFMASNVVEKLEALAEYDLHSIEQPIKKGQWKVMCDLSKAPIVPIALDEELIGITSIAEKEELLNTIKPQYIVLKPALIGGFGGTDEWVSMAEKHNIKWWVTSALESNIGLNAIAQYVDTKGCKMPQGLGTGQLFSNNIPSPLELRSNHLWYGSNSWDLSNLKL
ncbi:MAG: o-succinylbenzoate synthase [Crocinitomicaceae bacterium]|nr:o-succinylbenzoate synthase [Crocinitomicaceae bacterium]|tara:strand:- start:8032 stop:9081 length:1050 start_codon:yes stop_codon:yes gene_type:complete